MAAELLFWATLTTVVLLSSGSDINIGDKWEKIIPRLDVSQSKSWTLTAEPGSTVNVYCNDWRFAGSDVDESLCQSSTPLPLTVRVVFDDGSERRTYCGSQSAFLVAGKSSKMSIELTVPSRIFGTIECMAKAAHPPKAIEQVNVVYGKGITTFKWPETPGTGGDKTWKFVSNSDKKISLQCKIFAQPAEPIGVCVKDVITVDNGEGPKKRCDNWYFDVNTISTGREITLRAEFSQEISSYVNCRYEAISGPNPNEIDNVGPPPDDDSSEIGVVPGRRGTTCDCGRTNKQSARLINGTEVTHESKFPFMVSMRSRGDSHFCGASILSPVHILTAAHCVSDSSTKSLPTPEDIMPTVGAHSSRKDSSHGEQQRLKVKKVSIPEEWFKAKHSLAADIAILHLETPIRFSKWVGPVCLTPEEPPIVNQYIKAIGWGNTENGTPDILREADVLVLDKALCHQNEKEICFKSGRTASCNGDSGGPYVWADPETNRYTQVALVSYGVVAAHGNPYTCDGERFAGTNTAYWYKWIEKTMAESSTEHTICHKQH